MQFCWFCNEMAHLYKLRIYDSYARTYFWQDYWQYIKVQWNICQKIYLITCQGGFWWGSWRWWWWWWCVWGGGRGSVNPPPPPPLWLKISFLWDMVDKFDIFETRFLILVLLFNKSILLPANVVKLLDEWQTVWTLIRRRVVRRLIWVYTVCLGLSVRIRRVSTVIW